MRASAAFLARFFLLSAVLFGAWSFQGLGRLCGTPSIMTLGDAYANVVATVSNPLVRLTSGYRIVATVPNAQSLDVFIEKEGKKLVIPFRPRELFSGLIPFLALLGASGGLRFRKRLTALLIGVGVLFVFHVGLLVLGPYMTGHPQATLGLVWMRRVNRMIDVFYGFYGLVGFAALPFLLWYGLARPSRA